MRAKLSVARVVGIGGWLVLLIAVVVLRTGDFWTDPEVLMAEAQEALANGQTSRALEEARHAVGLAPDDPGYQVARGWIELGAGVLDSAAVSFNRALDLDPAAQDARLGLAETLVRQSRTDSAHAVLDLVPVSGAGRDERMQLARLYERTGDLDAALTVLEPVDDLDALQLKASLAERLERWDEAAVFYRGLVAAEPGNPACRESLARALARSEQEDEALVLYRELADESSLSPDGAVQYAWLLNARREYGPALAILDRAADSEDPDVLDLQARTAFWGGQWTRAEDLLVREVRSSPEDPELRRMLVAIRSTRREGNERTRLAMYPPSGDADEVAAHPEAVTGLNVNAALLHYARLVTRTEGDPEVLRQLALLLDGIRPELDRAAPGALLDLGRALEGQGEFAAAAGVYEWAWQGRADPPAEAAFRVARTRRWSGRPSDALPWYVRYLQSGDDTFSRDEVVTDWSLALLELGRDFDALEQIRPVAARPDATTEQLVIAARAATGAGRPGEAADYLARLAADDLLESEDRLWFAGQLQAAGRASEALAIYEEQADQAGHRDPALWETVGDLRGELGLYAGAAEAYERAAFGGRPVGVKRGDALRLSGDLDGAAVVYREVVDRDSAASGAWLGLARVLAEEEKADSALDAYEHFLTLDDGTGIETEIAWAYLAAGEFAEADRWALRAGADRPDAWDPRLIRAHALRMMGDRSESEALFDTLWARPLPEGSASALWKARVAYLEGRALEAYELFGEAVAEGVPEPGVVLIAQGDAALQHGDLRRAYQSYHEAQGILGLNTPLTRRMESVDSAMAPNLALPGGFSSNRDGVELSRWGGSGTLWAVRTLEIGAIAWRYGVQQDGLWEPFTRVGLGITDFFATPDLHLKAILGVDVHDVGSDELFAQVDIKKYLGARSHVGVGYSRNTVYTAYEAAFGLNTVRVFDLSEVGSSFYLDRVDLRGRFELGSEGRDLTLDAGWAGYQDGNDHLFASAGLQLPLVTQRGRWVTLTPNLYWETFDQSAPAYFSPENYVKAGLRAQAILDFQGKGVEAWVDPYWYRYTGTSGGGAQGAVSLFFHVGPTRFDLGGYMLGQSDGNRFYSLFGRFSVPIR